MMENSTFNQLLDANVAQLYNAAIRLQPTGNLALSPVSILYASALLYVGSSGSTKSNLAKSFRFDQYFRSDVDALLTAFSTSMANLTSTKSTDPRASFIISLVNAIFLQKGMIFQKQFQDNLVYYLESQAESKDFKADPEKSRREINKWVADRSNGRIQDVLPIGAVVNDSIAVLANALYFKANWEPDLQFEPFLTKKKDFTLLTGQTIQVDTMHQFVYGLPYAEDAHLDVKYIEYPYVNNQGAMLFLLPNKKDGLRALEKKLTAGVLGELQKKVVEKQVSVDIPKFRAEADLDLSAMLLLIGVREAFDNSTADFSNMAPFKFPNRWHISHAFHKAFVEIDEYGTEAAAVTLFVLGASADREPPKSFVADHPFIFAIRHNPTNAILFVGRVEEF
ncbi:leukocyte elastase inhibitor-like [Paramacrobiotus metropolitanus]|uniref:leukocyte elastase inhibitor-like n=1 Tax=Paramacrobiotus metropolitanus TaxID=2943436 RepID=UPI00244627CA|nr:leukocyte elastase inhibitor-like [Paramacrobiotus metropolitanus]